MSTKIFNGFRYTGPGGLHGCYRLLHLLRPTVEQMVVQKFASFVANTSSEIIDRCTLGKALPEHMQKYESDKSFKPYIMSFVVWKELLKEESVAHLGIYNTDFNISLFPMTQKMIIGIFHTHDRDWGDWFLEREFISEFAYWNSTDRPEDMSSREWNKREKLWQGAFKSVPSESSMEMKLAPAYEPTILAHTDPFFVNTVLKSIKPKEERAIEWARMEVMNQYFREEGHRNHQQGMLYSQSDEGIAELFNETQKIADKLIDIDAVALGKG